MKKAGLVISLLLSTSAANAQSAGYYEFIPYYNNDPFTFCTIGIPQDCWAPVSPALGTYVVTNQYCFNPTSAALFSRVCPHAFKTTGTASQSESVTHDPADASP
jgi:hypothetical protein